MRFSCLWLFVIVFRPASKACVGAKGGDGGHGQLEVWVQSVDRPSVGPVHHGVERELEG